MTSTAEQNAQAANGGTGTEGTQGETPAPPNASNTNDGNGNSNRSRGGRAGNNRSRQGRGTRTNSSAPVFKGNTPGMNGHVFQCHAETTNKQQFQDTVAALGEYINKEMKFPKDVSTLCTTGKINEIEEPEDVSSEAELSMTKKLILKAKVETYMARVGTQESNLQAIFSVIWGQCSPAMQAKLQTLAEYDARSEAWDCQWLLSEVKGVTHMFQGTRNPYLSIDDARSNYDACRQGPNESVHEYMKRFKTLVEVLEHYGAKIGYDEILIENEKFDDLAKPDEDNTSGIAAYRKRQVRAARDKTVAMGFMKRADRKRFGVLWAELQNLYSRGHNQYPTDLTSAYNMLVNYRPVTAPRNRQGQSGNNNDGGAEMSFLQSGDTTDNDGNTPGTDGVVYEDIRCFRCGRVGHYRGQCPAQEGAQFLQTTTTEHQCTDTMDGDAGEWSGFSFAQASSGMGVIPPTWVLLDSQSTVSVFRNKRLLKNVRRSDVSLKVHTNGGTQISNFVGDIPNFGEVWYNPQSLANILSMAAVRKVCRITMDSAVEPALIVHKTDGSLMKFEEFRSGLYYFDTAASPTPKPTSAAVFPYPEVATPISSQYSFINTVADNKRLFTKREVEQADKARSLFRKIDAPSYPDFEHYLRNNFIQNCPVTVDDIRRALLIYGPDPAALKGKTVNKGSIHVDGFQNTPPPAPILHFHSHVVLAIDILYINGIMFFTTISRAIKFRTITPIPNRNKATLLKELKSVCGLYEARGFTVNDIHGDQEFTCLTNDMRPARMNIANADDHVPEVERSIRTIKERVRSTIHGLPFRRLPKIMVKAMADKAVRSLNSFPARGGVSDTMSPLTIMTGRPNLDNNALSLDFGSYAQVFEANDPTNTTKARMTGAITLNPSDNAQGGFFFMSLTTGRRLSRLQWEALPMPDEVVARVEEMAEAEGQRLMGAGTPLFEWSPGVVIEDDDDVVIPWVEAPGAPLVAPNIAVTPPEVDPEDEDVEDETDGPEDEIFEHADGNETDTDADASVADERTLPSDEELYGTPSDSEPEDEPNPPEVEEPVDHAGAPEPETESRVEDYDPAQEAEGAPAENEALREAPHEHGHNLRGNRERSYDHRFDHEMDQPESNKSYKGIQLLQTVLTAASQGDKADDIVGCIIGIILTQMTAHAGIKKHVQLAVDALFKEFAQLDAKEVFEGVFASSLTAKQKREALRAINLIKEKRNGILKGRTCADGSTQRKDYAKEETTSPTVSNDSLSLSCMIDAREQRDVGCADVTGAYLNADMDVYTLLKLTGETVDIMCQVNSDYEKFVTFENGKKVLYLRLLKALYGCVRSALLWYELFATTLKDMGFELNPYDTCVANKIIDGHQCTVLWYVDDTKISHKDPQVVTDVIEQIEKKFGKMTVTRGRKHTFLGIDIDFREDKTVAFKMTSYLKEAIADYGESITRKATSPAKSGLFDIDDDSPPLDEHKAKVFHSIVAKLLYVSKRARVDIQLPISFLCTRVSKATEQDWAKLRRVLEFVNGTMEDEMVLGADDIEVVFEWVDAAFAVHADMKSHTGGATSFGRGALLTKSSKQKLNTTSSTEAELVGASDYVPTSLWMKRFLSSQGYELKKNTFYQDNQSAMKLEMNGRKSAGQRSRHIDIRYFFIKDQVAKENISIEYCPTESMLADFFTKPLQGALFRKLRDVIMGYKPTSALTASLNTESKERVGDSSDRPSGLSVNASQTDRTVKATESGGEEKAKRTYAEVVGS